MKILIIFFFTTSSLYSQVLWGIDTDLPKITNFEDWEFSQPYQQISIATKKNISGFDYVNILNDGESIVFVNSNPPDYMSEHIVDYLNCKLGDFYQRDSIFGGFESSISYRWRTDKKAVLLTVQSDWIKVDIVRLDKTDERIK